MKQHFTRMAILLAFGFLYACSSPNHLQQAEQHKQNQRYQSALESVQRGLNQQPDNPQALLTKARILENLVMIYPAGDRAQYYQQMAEALNRASEIGTENGRNDLIEESSSLRNKNFQREYESAANFMAGYQNQQPGNLLLPARPHLENALILEPENDNVIQSLVQVYSLNGYYDEAISLLLDSESGGWKPEERAETLGFLFYRNGDYDNAAIYLSDAWLNGRGSVNAGRGIANTYNKLGDSVSEREILEQLGEIEPENIYHHVALSKTLSNEVLAGVRVLIEASDTRYASEYIAELTDMSNEAEAAFERAFQINENHILTNLTAGLYFRNFGFLLNEAGQLYPNSVRAEIVEDYLYKSLNYLERASELDPDQPLVWNAIWKVYEFLGMAEQADYARERVTELQ